MYNRAILLGRLIIDPELKQTPNGFAVTTFSIAVDRPVFKKSGEKQVDFLDIVAWRQTAEFICRYFKKGQPILVEGMIQTRQYTDKEGANRRVWEILAERVSFTCGKDDSGKGKMNANVDVYTEMQDDGDLPF